MDISYVGEHLFPGQLGRFFVVLAFVSSLFSAVSWYFSTLGKPDSSSWKNLARIAFRIHSVAVIGIIASLFYIIYNHYFEYHYAWAHSSRALPTHYMISCFWEGQEGSFLLWAFWQLVLGNILVYTARSWESPVMAIINLSQGFILSMLLGVELFGQKIGSSPFILLRDAMQAPVFQRADYLSFVTDGNGLNPLLQNYWMVIHPPTLFLGFASMIVPFAYALAGVWQKRYKDWVTVATPWALFAVMVLGTGIIMGAFWAYEALNFGGYWAWDPVENASLIPWLTLIAGVHVMIAYRHSGHSYAAAVILVLMSFILVLYASFLTRSGILGEASVHAFTDLGMSGQLILFILAFFAISVWMVASRWKELPVTKKDEDTYSREFWLFIGALVLSISCIQIISATSIPVVNALLGTKIAPPVDVVQHYNKWQIPIAVLIALISGFAQFLKYRQTDRKKFFRSLIVILGMTALITVLIAWYGSFYTRFQYVLLIFASVFSILANARILGDGFKFKTKLAGSAVAHIGFALMLLGALISASSSEVISINTTGFGYGKEFDEKANRENILLWKNEPVRMKDYTVTYLGDSTNGPNIYYRVNYKRTDEKGRIKEDFTLYPNAQINPKMGLIASPDTRHYIFHDIYTHVSSVPIKDNPEDEHDEHQDEGYGEPKHEEIHIGDSVRLSNGTLVLGGLNRTPALKDMPLDKDDLAVGAMLTIHTAENEIPLEPLYIIRKGMQFNFPAKTPDGTIKVEFKGINPEKELISLDIYEKPVLKDYIIMKAIHFPFINLLWGGTIIMVAGFLISIIRRKKELKKAD